ncbi:hypothetical protein PF010_g30232, partial [Phytophthora fragariae]
TLEPKLGKDGSAAFSSVEYESLPKRLRVERDVAQDPFFELMSIAPDIDKASLDDMMVSLDAKEWAYQDPEAGKATRVQFMSAIFEHVVYMFKADPGDRVCGYLSLGTTTKGARHHNEGTEDIWPKLLSVYRTVELHTGGCQSVK